MWQRFTERARRAIITAQEEAVQLHNSEVSTGHLLLALLRETDSPAAQFLQATGLSADAMRQALAGQSPAPARDEGIILSPEMKNLLTDSAQIARELRHHDIDSHHLLLALLSNPTSSAAIILKPLQRKPQELYAGLLEQLKGYRASAQPDADSPPVSPGRSLFQRFTERARRVILLAQEEAGQMQSGEVGARHLFLGLVCENEGTAAQVLAQMGIQTEVVRHAVEMLDERKQKNGGELSLTLQAKRALELSAQEANALHHNHIGTEHLLLALLHRDCGLAPLLKKLDLKSDDLRRQVLDYLG